MRPRPVPSSLQLPNSNACLWSYLYTGMFGSSSPFVFNALRTLLHNGKPLSALPSITSATLCHATEGCPTFFAHHSSLDTRHCACKPFRMRSSEKKWGEGGSHSISRVQFRVSIFQLRGSRSGGGSISSQSGQASRLQRGPRRNPRRTGSCRQEGFRPAHTRPAQEAGPA